MSGTAPSHAAQTSVLASLGRPFCVVRTADNKISRPCKSGRRRSSMTCLLICCPDCPSTLRPPRSCTLRLWGGTEAETSDAVYCRTLLLGGGEQAKRPFLSNLLVNRSGKSTLSEKKWTLQAKSPLGPLSLSLLLRSLAL